MGGARFSVWCPWPPVWTPHTITDSVNTDVATMTSIAGEQSRVVKPQDEFSSSPSFGTGHDNHWEQIASDRLYGHLEYLNLQNGFNALC